MDNVSVRGERYAHKVVEHRQELRSNSCKATRRRCRYVRGEEYAHKVVEHRQELRSNSCKATRRRCRYVRGEGYNYIQYSVVRKRGRE